MFLNIDQKKSDSIALIDNEGERVSYGELVKYMNEFMGLVKARSVIFILCKNTVASVIGYLSFVNNDVVPILLSDKIDDILLQNLMSIYTPAYIWAPEEINRFSYEVIYKFKKYNLLKTGYKEYTLNGKLQICMTTSGSTGSPKLVRYKKGNLEANAKNVAIAFGWTENERPICDLGMQYTMGLNVINTHLYVGATLLLTTYNLMSGDFWKYITRERATNFTGVPFSYDLITRLHFERMDLPNLKTFSQGGGKLTDARFLQLAKYAQSNGKRFIASFGTTETSARMACLPSELALTKIGSIGKAIPEGEMFLIDENGEVLNELTAEGELCYRGPNVTMGYATSKEDLMKDDEFNG
ncbi:AMP-binding protein, partial [Ruminococcus albus]